MPNWCANVLIVEDDEELKVALAGVVAGGEDGRGLFDTFVPMPVELRDITRGGITIDGFRYRHWREKDGKAIPVTEQESAALTDKYGHADWYDWACSNWGTKWDVSAEGEAGRVWFDTAWANPEAFMRRLSAMYPEATLTNAYAEGGIGFWGRDVYRGGEKVYSEGSDSFWSDETDEDDMSLTTPECTTFLETYALHTGG